MQRLQRQEIALQFEMLLQSGGEVPVRLLRLLHDRLVHVRRLLLQHHAQHHRLADRLRLQHVSVLALRHAQRLQLRITLLARSYHMQDGCVQIAACLQILESRRVLVAQLAEVQSRVAKMAKTRINALDGQIVHLSITAHNLHYVELLRSGNRVQRSDVVHHGGFLVYNVVDGVLSSAEAVRPGPGDLYALGVKRATRGNLLAGHREHLLDLLKVAEIALQIGDRVQSIVGGDSAHDILLLLHLFKGGGQRRIDFLYVINWAERITLP